MILNQNDRFGQIWFAKLKFALIFMKCDTQNKSNILIMNIILTSVSSVPLSIDSE